MNATAIAPQVGMRIRPDGWDLCHRLEEGMTTDYWACQFYLPTGHDFGVKVLACNIQVTGRDVKLDAIGARRIRVRIVWVGDGEPNKIQGGWLWLD